MTRIIEEKRTFFATFWFDEVMKRMSRAGIWNWLGLAVQKFNLAAVHNQREANFFWQLFI
jgi:hypothetical protein